MATETLAALVEENGTIGKVFGTHIIEYRNLLTYRMNSEAINQTGGRFSGASDEWFWYTRKIDLMSEMNVFGLTVWSSSGYDTGIDNRQYALFQLKPELINSYKGENFSYWLKDVVATTKFSFVGNGGGSRSAWYVASKEFGVRPRFLVG